MGDNTEGRQTLCLSQTAGQVHTGVEVLLSWYNKQLKTSVRLSVGDGEAEPDRRDGGITSSTLA